MKHKAVFTKVRKLINERELADDNLDQAEDSLVSLLEKDRQCDWAYGLLAEIQYWRGEMAALKDKLALFEQGVEYGEEAIKINENSLEGNFWLAVNYGMYGNEKGILKSLSLIKPIQQCAERVIDIDESYFYGGPWRVLGRIYDKVPGWPVSIGDKHKAIECFEAALEFGPKFYLNHIYIAECYMSLGNKAKAKYHLQWVLDAPLSKHHEREDAGYKREAQALLKKLG